MKEIVTEIQINASPEKVWSVLAAGHDWGSWNPFVVRVEGELKVGARLKNTLVMKGRKPMVIAPKVLVADSAKELRWLGRLGFRGLFDGEHYFLLKPKDNGTQLVHGEKFSGILIGMLNMSDAKESFEALNRGLKAQAERS